VLPEAGDVQSVNFANVIDVAAHIQKACPPGGIAVSEAAATQLPGGPSSVGSEWVETPESKGVVWLPRLQGAFPGA
jgi:class 3 adenylate cyclase